MRKRFKTDYPGVYYRNTKSTGKIEPERVYYIVYRRNGKVVEGRAGGQNTDNMSPERASIIRADIIEGKRLARKEMRTIMKEEKALGVDVAKSQTANPKLIEEKWLLFMESATDSFTLLDSELNIVETNSATLKLYPPGTTKQDVIGKNILDVAPDTKARGEYDRFREVIINGTPFTVEEVTSPPIFGNKYLKYKAFKVGDGLGMIITDITDRKRKEEALKRNEAELKVKNIKLENANTALKVLLKIRDDDKKDLEEKMVFNVKELIGPYIEQMKETRLDERQKGCMDIIGSSLNDIISPLIRKMSGKQLGLTSMEIQVANFIKHGRSSKEIANILSLSINTIASYRNSIRKKLGLSKKEVNLRTYLLSIK